MFARQALALLLGLLLAFPVWGDPNIVGSVASSHSAMVRGTNLTPGSTIFSGDTIEVAARGSAWITLSGGAQVQVAENSQVRLTKETESIQLTVDRGGASFRSLEKSPVEARLGDATIRSANGLPAVGVVHVRSAQSAIIAAEKGALVIATAHDSKSVTLREGEGAEVILVEQNDQGKEKKDKGGAVPAGSTKSRRRVAIVFILAGATTGIGALVGRRDPGHTTPENCNAVSPFRCP